ncbi:alpha/beta hydrolase family protein [Alteraurantiacibacter aestuarii]|uniref:Alpha/beta fold hydrolase n=1 Tax=Alteraurantiacibacter aestuarii TaxID=650004 RepID=A0A844ZM12_9SPHN|nr:alpha/beta fold hydrolase [Alteraurantiacibacter aestuarii]MXO88352.1 alpha/beta fold hydrolase [Alteraurantiacibacter aestuarii]
MLRQIAPACAIACAAIAALLSVPSAAQDHARINEVTFHSPALEGNWEGNPADRLALVFTPPGYDENPGRHYRVVYFLHGYWATPQMYQDFAHFEEAVDEAAAAGEDFILVMPDGQSRMRGSFYSSSPTTGDFETYVARDLVAYVDANFRTVANRESRGLAGHSMGGYGTLRLGMKFPDVFSSIYAMSACCQLVRDLSADDARQAEGITDEVIADAEFGQLGAMPFLAAWSPDPDGTNFVDNGLLDDGTIDPAVTARIAANSIIPMLPQYLPNLRQLEAIAFDVGNADSLSVGNEAMHQELLRFGVDHVYEVYEGDHGNRIAARIRSHVLPFFAEHLDEE